ncbi:MAG: serine protease [Myxococcota bacterium]
MAPTPTPGFVVHPAFHTPYGRFEAGKAFVVRLQEEGAVPWVVACQHLLGPAGGIIAETLKGEHTAGFVQGVEIHDALDPESMQATTRATLTIPGADGDDPERDLCAFELDPSYPGTVLAWASKGSWEPGRSVWLASPLRQGEGCLHEGTVLHTSGGGLVQFAFAKDLNPRGTSGAPVLDAEGALVGMMVRFQEEDDRLLGYALNSATIHALLSAATVSAHPEQVAIAYPKSILPRLSWSLGNHTYDSAASVDAQIKSFYQEYYPECSDERWNPDDVALRALSVRVQFRCVDREPPHEHHYPWVTVHAPEGADHFTALDLVFGMHNAMAEHMNAHNRDMFDHHFFEGLSLVRLWNGPETVPHYYVDLGS